MTDNKKRGSIQLLKTLIFSYKKHSFIVLVCLIFSGVAEGIGIASLIPLLNMTMSGNEVRDDLISRSIERFLFVLGLEPSVGLLLCLIVVVISIKALLVLLAGRQVGYTAAHVATDLRLSLIRGLMKARWKYYVDQPTGSLTNSIATEAERASKGYITACRIIASLIQIGVYAYVALLISWQVTLGAMLAGILMIAVLNFLIKIARQAGMMRTNFLKSIAIHLTDGLQGMKSLKAMACEDRLEPLLEGDIIDLKESQRKQVISKEGLRGLQEPILALALAVGLYGALMFLEMEMATLMVMILLFGRTVEQIGKIQTFYQKTAISESAYWSIRKAIGKADKLREINTGNKIPHLEKGIYFDNVSFAYSKTDVLKGVSFTVPAKMFTAVNGPSGAGKTTIADLVIGLMKSQSGDIRIDDLSLRDVNMDSWRRMIGYVPQETTLFHESILVNVTLGDFSITSEKVEIALREAGIWDFVSALPRGIETIVGERGAKLSGGQRQRIAIARALARNPKLLILDEATTALDPQTEAEICEILKQLARKVTILAISHQTALMDVADVVYHLDGGTIKKIQKISNDIRMVNR